MSDTRQFIESLIGVDDDEEFEESSFRWESGYEKTWETVKEAQGGRLVADARDDGFASRGGASSLEAPTNLLRGMIRNLVVIVDFSACMRQMDMKPDRINATTQTLEKFITEFFSWNPISQLSLIAMSNGTSHVLTPLTAHPEDQARKLNAFKAQNGCRGVASFQNVLERALALLTRAAAYGTREIVMVTGSLSTVDNGNMEDTIAALAEKEVRCSVVSLAPEMRILKHLCSTTGGSLKVPMDRASLESNLMETVRPPPWSKVPRAVLVEMAFPVYERANTLALCMCHATPGFAAYVCPKCKGRCCEIPARCKVCGIHLLSSVDLVKSYQHLFPLEKFVESDETAECFGCGDPNAVWKCRRCEAAFCRDCDIFCHTATRQCASCAT